MKEMSALNTAEKEILNEALKCHLREIEGTITDRMHELTYELTHYTSALCRRKDLREIHNLIVRLGIDGGAFDDCRAVTKYNDELLKRMKRQVADMLEGWKPETIEKLQDKWGKQFFPDELLKAEA